MPLLEARIAATRELLQSAPDQACSIELYLTLNTDPARIERFLIRARGMKSLSNVYVIPQTAQPRTRVRVTYGFFGSRKEAQDAIPQVPAKYRDDFQLVIRDFKELRGAL